jgi:hypothetical protein
MQRLIDIRLAAHMSLLPAGMDAEAARAQLAGLLAARTGPETAGLFAEIRDEGGVRGFFAPPGEVAPIAALDAEGQGRLQAELGRLASALRRAAGTDARLQALVRGAIEVPRADCIFAHEGRPILAGWGLTLPEHPQGLGLVAALDDGRREPAPPARPWGLLGATALALLGLGTVAAFAVPHVAAMVSPGPAACVPGPSDRLEALLRGQDHENALRAGIAEALRELGSRRAACALPTPVQAADLPQERWQQRDLSLLEGCWNLDSDYATRDRRTGVTTRVRSWQMCFDRNGRGRQTLVYENGVRCEAPAIGRFAGEAIIVDDTQDVRCGDNSFIYQRRMTCRRASDSRAECEAEHTDPRITGRSSIVLRR